jgi:hypothetical protein
MEVLVLVDVELLLPVGEIPTATATGLLFIVELELVLVICTGTRTM